MKLFIYIYTVRRLEELCSFSVSFTSKYSSRCLGRNSLMYISTEPGPAAACTMTVNRRAASLTPELLCENALQP